jgi:hypothetical protein
MLACGTAWHGMRATRLSISGEAATGMTCAQRLRPSSGAGTQSAKVEPGSVADVRGGVSSASPNGLSILGKGQ